MTACDDSLLAANHCCERAAIEFSREAKDMRRQEVAIRGLAPAGNGQTGGSRDADSMTAHSTSRNTREFEALLREHRGIVYKIAKSYCPAGEEPDDLAQEICMQLWRSFPRYDP